MRYWFDTEFWEQKAPNGGGIQLISIGIVSEDGRELYLENADFDWDGCTLVWLHQNVRPHLTGGDALLPFEDFAQAIIDFVGEDKHPEWVGYFADYDWVSFCWIFGTMMDLPKGWPMFAVDIQQWRYMIGRGVPLPKQTSIAHNALNDARWTREAWFFLWDLTTSSSRARGG